MSRRRALLVLLTGLGGGYLLGRRRTRRGSAAASSGRGGRGGRGRVGRHPVLLIAAGCLAALWLAAALPGLPAVVSLAVVVLVVVARRRRRAARLATRCRALGELSPDGFERAVWAILAGYGWRLRQVGGPGDLGADLLGWDGTGQPVVVQCKRYAGRVGSPVVQAVIGAAVIHRARPVLVCSGGFTAAAVTLGRSQGVELVDGPTLSSWRYRLPGTVTAGQMIYLGTDDLPREH